VTSADPLVRDEPARPERPPLPAAVLWDMDGTLVDTEPYWFAAERDLVDEFGHGQWPDDLAKGMVGFDLLDGAAYLQQHGGVDLPPEEIVDRLLDGVIARLHRHIPWRPGVLELLDDLRADGVPCALVTMSWRRFVDPVLAALPERTFAAVITGDEVPHGEGKPSPTPYLLGAEGLGVDPADCVAIEDSPTGVASALGAGCRVLGVPNVTTPEPQPGLTLIESLDGVEPRHLAQLFERRPLDDGIGHRIGPLAAYTRALNINPTALLVVMAATVTALAAWWWFGRGDDQPTLPPGAVAVDVWVPYWTLDDVAADGYDRLDQVREISPFWFGTRGVDEIVVDEQAPAGDVRQFLDAVDDGDLVPSIRDQMPAGGMAAILADEAQRVAHIDTILEFADEYDAAGIDLDYEQFAFADSESTWVATRPNWVAFVEELAAALHDDGRTLTVSIPGVWGSADAESGTGTEGYWVYDHGAIIEHIDALRIMAYDYSVAEPGPVAPVDWVGNVVDTLSAVVPEEYHDRLVLGVPAYGVNWVVSTLGECPESATGRTGVTARGAHDLAARRGGTPVYEPLTAEWSFTYALEVTEGEESCVQNRLVRWVDGDGVAERVMLARAAGWGGVSLWALGYDDPEVWNQLTLTARRDLSPSDGDG
jgi:HAD superfamily hydrolase (TIGR01509 family)